jgi:hypothetical protein
VLLLKIEETAPLIERKRQREEGRLEVKVESDAGYIADRGRRRCSAREWE